LQALSASDACAGTEAVPPTLIFGTQNAFDRISSIALAIREAVSAKVELSMSGAIMFGKRQGDHNPRRFWSWFSSQAEGICNAIEALSRGEADAEWALIGLNERIHRYDAGLEADVLRTPDGRCQIVVSGGDQDSILLLLNAAPSLPGWTFLPRLDQAQTSRVPFRAAPRPSLDQLAAPLSALHEAYAV
jgi:hypothetical protein